MDKGTSNQSVRKAQILSLAVELLRRRRHPAVWLACVSASLFAIAFSGQALSWSIPIGNNQIVLQFANDGGAPALAFWGLFWVAATVMAWGFLWFCWDVKKDNRKRVVVLEVRGLRDFDGSSLTAAVPNAVRGQREPRLIDLRQGSKDGRVGDPQTALDKLSALPALLKSFEGGGDRCDYTLVYGGLAPVPFTFLTGTLVDDEGSVVVMDWDRHKARWRELDGLDDGARFEEEGLVSIEEGKPELILAVSVSYRVDYPAISEKLPGLPIVRLTLQGGTTDSHWSRDKQVAIGQQFLNTVIKLGNLGVGRIHLFLAAPNSVVFRLGQLYDRRNLPELVVYQYERHAPLRYPWGVRMPASGESKGALV